jgi:chemotaxis protein methyltransferase CheR
MRQRGVDLRQYKTSFLRRRVEMRMREKGLGTYAHYAALLDKRAEEYGMLFNALSINVTEFFRDPKVFDSFSKYVLPALLESHRGRTIRVWSAGCATGEEAYSIAILFKEAQKYGPVSARIIATDVSKDAVQAAKQGRYGPVSLQGVPRYLLAKYFHRTEKEGVMEINREVKDSVLFSVGNLLTGDAPRFLDIIFCRNVIMYIERSAQNELLSTFQRALGPGGYLVLGMAETIIGARADLFDTFIARDRIYRKSDRISADS